MRGITSPHERRELPRRRLTPLLEIVSGGVFRWSKNTYRAERTRIYGDGVNITACLEVFALFVSISKEWFLKICRADAQFLISVQQTMTAVPLLQGSRGKPFDHSVGKNRSWCWQL